MSVPGVPTRSPLRSEVDAAIAAAVSGKESAGVAASLLTAHVGAADPHPQYARKATLATVATSGSYADLADRPTIPSTPGQIGAQPFDGDLLALAQIEPQLDDMIVRKSTGWVSRNPAQVRTDLSLSNVDNTSDAYKPVSTATQTALNLKTNASTTTALDSRVGAAESAITGKIGNALVDAKGDVIVGSGPDTPAVLPVGTNTHVLTADSAAPFGVKWAAPAAGGGGGIRARTSTGRFVGAFGPCSASGTWTVCPAAWRPPAIIASAGNLVDWRCGGVLGVSNASGDAEFDVAAIDNSNPLAPVILRCLSSGTNTPLANGDGGLYAWANNARVTKMVEDWVVQADELVAGTLTLALLYRAGGSGLSFGHASVYPSKVTMINYGTPTGV